MNTLDSASVAAALQRAGHEQAPDEASADLVLVNSCTVTAESDRKSRKAAASAARSGKRVVVLGCGPRVDPLRWERELPRALVAANDAQLARLLSIELSDDGVIDAPRTRLPVPVQYGCDNTCAYCITRLARGPHRSEPLDRIVDRVRIATEAGVREVVLTGINLGAWGCSSSRRPAETKLPFLLRTLLDRTAIHRIRLSSLGPEYLDDAFFEVFADERVCDHLHLSVQSGSADVLRRMQRGYGLEQVMRSVERAREQRRHVAVTGDFIVGLPGETDVDFAQTLELVRAAAFAQLHVFPFSPREGTAAAHMPDRVPPAIKRTRADVLRSAGLSLRSSFLSSQFGRTLELLVDGPRTGMSTNYIRVRADGEKGTIVHAVLTEWNVVERRS